VVSVGTLLAVGMAAAPWAATAAAGSTRTTGTSKTISPRPLIGPKTSPTQDTTYLSDVAKADPALASYIQARGNTALRALLTDGGAFCAFLHRGGGIDNAILSVAVGAKSVESKTHLPSKVATFNTMEAVALLTLCPTDRKLVPAAVRSRLHALAEDLAK
jgi:hypothetical protein